MASSSNKNSSGKNPFQKLKREFKMMYREFTGWVKTKLSNRKVEGSPKSFKRSPLKKKSNLEKSTKIIVDSLKFIGEHWKTFTIILLVYIGTYFVLAYARPNINLPDVFKEAQQAGNQVGVGDKFKTLSGAMFTYRGNATDFARWAQFFLAIVFSLVFIYAIRSLHKGIPTRARDALYGGTGNLIPFIMNICLIALQLIPFTIVGLIYGIGMNKQYFVGPLEKYSAVMILVMAALLTFWFIPTSLISLYAVTVPGVYPSKAMQAVRIIVSRRRLEVVRHLVVFLLFIFLSYLLLLLLLVTYLPRFANLSLDLFFLVSLPLIHVMMYKLYLKLLEGSQGQQS